ncbi:AAA family ATPase [Coxiella endosymbiont of Ornithodoros maritimus]
MHRKLIPLRGARQVGKTTVVRQLGEQLNSFVEVNLEI